MNFKNFKPFERIPTDVQLMICKKAHTDCLEEVKLELHAKHTLSTFEKMIRCIKEYHEIHLPSEPSEYYIESTIQDILLERYMAGYVDLVPTTFECLKGCNCCEYHRLSYLNLKEYIGKSSEFYTDTCKCSCARFRYICIDADDEYYEYKNNEAYEEGEEYRAEEYLHIEFPIADMFGVVL